MSDVLTRNIHSAMRIVAQALRTDDNNNDVETYWQYLQCINMIVQTLIQDINTQGLPNFAVSSSTVKYVKLGQQCLERIETLIEQIGSRSIPSSPPPQYTSMAYQGPPVGSATNRVPGTWQAPTHRTTPVQSTMSPQSTVNASTRTVAQRETQAATSTSPAGRFRAQHITRSRSIELRLSLQRKLMENAEIAKARKAALKRRMQEQQARYEEEAKKRFTSAEDQAFYAQVIKYEQSAVWPVAWRERLSQTPEDDRLIQLLFQQILRNSDHPITAEIVKQRNELYARISPFVVQHVNHLQEIKVVPRTTDVGEERAGETEKDSVEDFVKIEKEELDVKFSPVRGSPVNLNDEKDLFLPDSIFDDEDDETYDDDSNKLTPQEEAATAETEPKSDEVANQDLESSHGQVTFTPVKNTHSLDSSEIPSESLPDHTPMPSVISDTESETTEPHRTLEAVALLPEFSHILKSSLHLVHSSLEQLQHLFIVAYQQLDTPGGRQQVALWVEDALFQQLWDYVIVLFRLAHLDKELALSKLMTRYYGCMPQDFGVREKFTLIDCPNDDSYIPYHAAINETQRVGQLQSPMRKLEALVSVSMNICKAAQEHLTAADPEADDTSSIGADDLIPILAYVLVQSGQPQLISECAALEEFIHEDFLFGEEGYALASFSACISHLLSLVASENED